jgi:hypothetical protein
VDWIQLSQDITIKNTIFWIITSYSLVETCRSFGGCFRFSLPNSDVGMFQSSSVSDPEDGGNNYLRNISELLLLLLLDYKYSNLEDCILHSCRCDKLIS